MRILFLFFVVVLCFSGCVERAYQKVPAALGLPEAERIVTESQVTLRQGEHTFVFERGKRTATLDGILYYLHAPAGMDTLNTMDCQIIRYGIVAPGKQKAKLNVMIDAGHGGTDPGCMKESIQERNITLAIAKEVEALLKAKGHTVFMTRTEAHQTIALSERTTLASQQPLDAFVSIHVNAAVNPQTKGVEVFTIPAPGCEGTPPNSPPRAPMLGQIHLFTATRLAMAVQRELLAQDFKPADRGVKHAHFKVLRDTPAPSILVETGFLTNADDYKTLTSPEDQKKTARAIVRGIERALALSSEAPHAL